MTQVAIKKAVGYARISSVSQIDNTSIDFQVEKINLYCKLHGIKLENIFIDEGYSGSNTESRNSYNKMMDYAFDKDNEINAIIVLKSDRIHRKLKNLLIMIEELEDRNLAFISITEQFDTSTSHGMLILQMMGSFSEFERKIINERTYSGRIKKASYEKYPGGRVPYGYFLLNSDSLHIHPEESEIVKNIFSYRKEGYSLKRIADYLNKEKIKPKYSEKWTKQAVDYVLKNEIYTGVYKYNGNKEKNSVAFKIPKIISKTLYNKVNNA